MPLDRDHVTLGSRTMLPTYPMLAIGFGGALLLTPLRELLTVPAYRTAHDVLPMHLWAGLFITVGIVQIAALVVHRRPVYIYSLALLLVLLGVFTAVFVTGAARGTNPWTAPMFPAFAARACWATIRSLAAGETGHAD